MKFGNLTTLNGKIDIEELVQATNLLLIYFSEHNTPLCSKQLLSFKEEFETIHKYDIITYAVSTDSIQDITIFAKTLNDLPFEIASDEDGLIAKQLNVYNYEQKKANRSIFILNKQCEIIYSNLYYQPENIDEFFNVFEYISKNIKLRQ